MGKFEPKRLDLLGDSSDSSDSSDSPSSNDLGFESELNRVSSVASFPWEGLDPSYESGALMKTQSTSFNPYERAVLEYLNKHTPLSTRQRIRKVVAKELKEIIKKIENGTFDARYD